MKSSQKKPVFGFLILGATLGSSVASSLADGRREHVRIDFELGVCVGQTLADQGTVPSRSGTGAALPDLLGSAGD